jgi:hypothetical protein
MKAAAMPVDQSGAVGWSPQDARSSERTSTRAPKSAGVGSGWRAGFVARAAFQNGVKTLAGVPVLVVTSQGSYRRWPLWLVADTPRSFSAAFSAASTACSAAP